MTEDEATTKWCPFTKVYGPSGSYNRSSNLGSDAAPMATLCCGSDCFVWRVLNGSGFCGLGGSSGAP